MVIAEFFSAGVNAMRLFCQSLAADHIVLELDVGQLVFQLGCIEAIDHMWSFSQGYFEREVFVKVLGVENTVVGEGLMVQPYPVLAPVHLVQLFFSVDA